MASEKLKNVRIRLFVDVNSEIDRLSTDHLRLWVCVVSLEHASSDDEMMPLHYGAAVGYGGGGVQEAIGFAFNEWNSMGMISHEVLPDGFEEWFDEEESGDLGETNGEGCPPGYDPEDWQGRFLGGSLDAEVQAIIRSKLLEWLEEDESGGHVVVKADAVTRMSKADGLILRYAEDEDKLLEVIDSVASLWGWPMHLKYQNSEFENLTDGLYD